MQPIRASFRRAATNSLCCRRLGRRTRRLPSRRTGGDEKDHDRTQPDATLVVVPDRHAPTAAVAARMSPDVPRAIGENASDSRKRRTRRRRARPRRAPSPEIHRFRVGYSRSLDPVAARVRQERNDHQTGGDRTHSADGSPEFTLRTRAELRPRTTFVEHASIVSVNEDRGPGSRTPDRVGRVARIHPTSPHRLRSRADPRPFQERRVHALRMIGNRTRRWR